ncbi:MAG: TetR/AcrR family transcriptional regulator [Acidimicrobiales bacterium]|nr:TetR/AcrR family transcriptional regulator [Acidimicrobiales bacterium]
MSTGTPTTRADLQARLQSVPRPAPLLDRERERALTSRQREILDQLGGLFENGFTHLTMAEIASRLSCSLRTLYELAPSRDELVLMVVDRNLWRVGRRAASALDEDMAPLDAIRSYLRAATVAVVSVTPAVTRDLASIPAGRDMYEAHSDYIVGITRCLLDLAIERGDISPVDTAALARVMAGVGRDFSRAEVISTLCSSPKEAADEVVDVILRGLQGLRSDSSSAEASSVRRAGRA